MGSVFQLVANGDQWQGGTSVCGPHHQLSRVINIVPKATAVVALLLASVVQYIGHRSGKPGVVLKMRILTGDKTWFWQCQ